MADEKKNYKELIVAKLKAANPDLDITDETLIDHIGQYDEDRDARYGEMEKSVKGFTDLLADNEYATGFISHLGAGGHPLDYIIDNWDDDVSELLNDPDRKEKFEKGIAAKKAALAKAEEESQARQTAMYDSLDRLVKIFDPTIDLEVLNGADETAKQTELAKLDAIDEKVQAVVDFIQGIADGFVSGNISDETFGLAVKALNFDEALSEAEKTKQDEVEAARIAAKNEKIAAQMKKDVGGGTDNAGLPPNVGGQRTVVEYPKNKQEFSHPLHKGLNNK